MIKVLSIIIPVYNKINFTLSCLKDLSHLPNDHEIIIFDNGSKDDTKSKLENSTEITYIRSEENLGFGKANNNAYNISSAPNVLFLNNDIRVRGDIAKSSWTAELLKYCNDYIVGPTMGQLNKDLGFVQEANQYLSGISYMSGWCMASSKKNWDKLDTSSDSNRKAIFDEDYFVYFEDTDLSMRARKAGINFKVVSIPVVHFGKTSSKELNVPKLYTEAKKIFTSKWKNRI